MFIHSVPRPALAVVAAGILARPPALAREPAPEAATPPRMDVTAPCGLATPTQAEAAAWQGPGNASAIRRASRPSWLFEPGTGRAVHAAPQNHV